MKVAFIFYSPEWEGGDTQRSFIQGGPAAMSNPLSLYIPFFTEKLPLSYTFY